MPTWKSLYWHSLKIGRILMNEGRQVTPDDSIAAVAVVIPVNNEEDLLPRCLVALDASVDALRQMDPTIAIEVVVVLDACTDESPAVAAQHNVRVTTINDQCVGAARAVGAAHAASLLGVGVTRTPMSVWLANTDADSAVPSNWLTQHVTSATSGVDLVIGRVQPDRRDITDRVHRTWASEHQSTDPLHHFHGANLGVRWNMLNAVGGFSHVSEHEDVLLVEALLSEPVRVALGPEVLTSGRAHGRAPGGFSGYLRNLTLERDAPNCGV